MRFHRFFGALAMLGAMSVVVLAQGGAQSPAKQSQEDEFLKGVYLSDAPELVAPSLLKQTYPKYTSDAMRAKLQGEVEIQAVVGIDGTVERARITKSLDPMLGLDQEALAAAKRWVFKPGTLRGQAVPVAVTVKLEFRLH